MDRKDPLAGRNPRNEDTDPDRPVDRPDRVDESKAPPRVADPESPQKRAERARENLAETGREKGGGRSPGEGDPI
ncbi:MAG: hypothetical protein AB7O56_05335 [Bauldia sp.]